VLERQRDRLLRSCQELERRIAEKDRLLLESLRQWAAQWVRADRAEARAAFRGPDPLRRLLHENSERSAAAVERAALIRAALEGHTRREGSAVARARWVGEELKRRLAPEKFHALFPSGVNRDALRSATGKKKPKRRG